MSAPTSMTPSQVWYPWMTGTGWPWQTPPFFPPTFPPPVNGGDGGTRGLQQPLDPGQFGPPPNGTNGGGAPSTGASGATYTQAELTNLRELARLIKTARADVASSDKAVARAARRRLKTLAAYAIGFLEAKGGMPLGTLTSQFAPSAEPDFDKAAADLADQLDDIVANPDGTRALPLLAGVIIGILVDRAVDNLTS